MYQFLTKNGQALAFGVGLLLTIIYYVFASSGNYEFGISAMIGLTVLCFLLMLGFGIFQLISNPKAAVKGLGGIAFMVVLYFIGSSMMGIPPINEAMGDIFKEFGITDGISGYINGAIVSGLAMCALCVLVFVASEIRNFFK